LEDEIMVVYTSRLWRWCGALLGRHTRLAAWLGPFMLRRGQHSAERLHARMRRDLLTMDEHLETALAFSGRLE